MKKRIVYLSLFMMFMLLSCSTLKLHRTKKLKDLFSKYQEVVELEQQGELEQAYNMVVANFFIEYLSYADSRYWEEIKNYDYEAIKGYTTILGKRLRDSYNIIEDFNDYYTMTGREFDDSGKEWYRLCDEASKELNALDTNIVNTFNRISFELKQRLEHKHKLDEENKRKTGEFYNNLEEKFPRFYSYLESKDYLKYFSGNLEEDLKNLRNTLLKDCDDFEANDAARILETDCKVYFSNPNRIFSRRTDKELKVKSVSANYENKTYTYTVNPGEYEISSLVLSIIDGLKSCGCNNIGQYLDAEKYLYVVGFYINVELPSGQIHKSKEHKSIFFHNTGLYGGENDFDDFLSVIGYSSIEYAMLLASMRDYDFENIPSKDYKSVEFIFTNISIYNIDDITEKMNEIVSNNGSEGINDLDDLIDEVVKDKSPAKSDGYSGSSNPSFKDLFGTIVCEECGKHLALYDCFDPVKNVRVSLCRPCLQRKEQDYNAKYQKAINDIKNL